MGTRKADAGTLNLFRSFVLPFNPSYFVSFIGLLKRPIWLPEDILHSVWSKLYFFKVSLLWTFLNQLLECEMIARVFKVWLYVYH